MVKVTLKPLKRYLHRHGVTVRWLVAMGILFAIFNIYLDREITAVRGRGSRSLSMVQDDLGDDGKHYFHDNQSKHQRKRQHGPIGQKQSLAASHALSEKTRLEEIQADLIQNQQRPPDSKYNVNVTNSDSITISRNITDTRPPICQTFTYDLNTLPKVSVVIPFYNEALSILLRTIHSVLDRSPDILLDTIMLVDDHSNYTYLHAPLDRYLDLLPKVHIIRNKKREGLIRSRLLGANATTSPVIVFLDAHSEVNVGWLEPILKYLKDKPHSVVQPFVDGIDPVNFNYSKPSDLHRGGFTWDLRYVWIRVPDYLYHSIEEYGVPYFTPTLVGCALAVNRDYFQSIGTFDEDAQIWGGENLELAFRVWMCNGTVVTIPCSRVGHLFRPLPYRDEKNWMASWQKNLMRIAEVWLGDYKHYFYSSTRIYPVKRINFTTEELKSLQRRIDLRDRLKCHNFRWYVENVVPEIPFPPHDASYHGQVTNFGSNACWTVLEDNYLSISYACYEHKLITKNVFSMSKDGLLMYQDKCVHFLWPNPVLKVSNCPNKVTPEVGYWRMSYRGPRWAQIQFTKTNPNGKTMTMCVMQVTSAVNIHKRTQMPQAAHCDEKNKYQYWAFDFRFDFYG